MELTFYTDYSLRVLIYLGLRRPQLSMISEIADDYRISRNHLMKVVHGLARGGFIRTYRGKGGGMTLDRHPRDINIGALVRYTEGAFKPAECFRGADDRCVISGACRLAGILQEACDSFLATLDRYTLHDLLARPAKLRLRLALPSVRSWTANGTARMPVSQGAVRLRRRIRKRMKR